MPSDRFDHRCQNCGGDLEIARMGCSRCGLAVEGKLTLPRLARLNPEDREFIEIFVLAAGSLKEAGKILNLSYPTVRARLDKVIENLRQLDQVRRRSRMEVLDLLAGGSITAEEASQRLAETE